MKYRAPSCEGFHPEAIKWSGGKLKFEAYLVLCWCILLCICCPECKGTEGKADNYFYSPSDWTNVNQALHLIKLIVHISWTITLVEIVKLALPYNKIQSHEERVAREAKSVHNKTLTIKHQKEMGLLSNATQLQPLLIFIAVMSKCSLKCYSLHIKPWFWDLPFSWAYSLV